jgi:O-antigen/teichoic acid export membrane protein
MSIEKQVFKGVSWLALFKLIGQLLSWVSTIIVARILLPDDYGLMTMATFLTGYAQLFSQLGLGYSIMQRVHVTNEEVNSVFWFSTIISIIFAIIGFCLAYPTAYIFHDLRLIPITQVISVLFIINGLQIVPLNLLRKELNFKSIGIIELISTIASTGAMIVLAYLGFGIWTLVLGQIFLATTKLILLFLIHDWFPKMYYNFKEAKHFVMFGVSIALTTSFFYLMSNMDRFFAGRAWDSKTLGFYVFALTLAQLPTEKITTLVNQVTYPAFCKVQNDGKIFNQLYLRIIKVTALFVFPLFVGGFLVGEDLVRILFNEKWLPIIFLFKFLCLTQIITSLNAINSFVHQSQSRPSWSLYYIIVCLVCMSVSFYFSVQISLNAILIPWFSTYLLLCIGWILFTINKMHIPIKTYLLNLSTPSAATFVMVISVIAIRLLMKITQFQYQDGVASLIIKLLIGTFSYMCYIIVVDKESIYALKRFIIEKE